MYTYIQRRQWHPTPVFLPVKSHGWRSLVGYLPWGRKESDTTERLHFHFQAYIAIRIHHRYSQVICDDFNVWICNDLQTMSLDLWKFDFEESKQLAKNPLLVREPCFKFVKNIKIVLICDRGLLQPKEEKYQGQVLQIDRV